MVVHRQTNHTSSALYSTIVGAIWLGGCLGSGGRRGPDAGEHLPILNWRRRLSFSSPLNHGPSKKLGKSNFSVSLFTFQSAGTNSHSVPLQLAIASPKHVHLRWDCLKYSSLLDSKLKLKPESLSFFIGFALNVLNHMAG